MKINPIIATFQRQNQPKQNNTSFSGTRQTRLVNVGSESNVRDFFGRDDIPTLGSQRLLVGKQKLIRLSGTYEPSVTLKGTVYVCDPEEWAGDVAKETNAAVIVNKGKESLTMEEIDREEKHSVSEMRYMIRCLRDDIEYQKKKIGALNARLSNAAEEERDSIQAEKNTRTIRLQELKEMKLLADKNLEETLAFLKKNHYDFKRARKRRELGARSYY